MEKNLDTRTSFASTLTLLSKKKGAPNSKIRLVKTRLKGKPAVNNRYCPNPAEVSGFYNYSIKSNKNKDINTYSGQNIRQEASKEVARNLLLERKLQQGKALVGNLENETQLLLDYYNNRHFIDKEVQERNQDYFKFSANDLSLDKVNNLSNSVNQLQNPTNEKALTSSKDHAEQRNSTDQLPKVKECYSQKSNSSSKAINRLEIQPAGKASGNKNVQLNISESADPSAFRRPINFEYSKDFRASTELKSNTGLASNGSVGNLSKPQRNIISSIKKINQNRNRLHNHSKINWSIADIPENYITSPSRAATLNSRVDEVPKARSSLSLHKHKYSVIETPEKTQKLQMVKDKLRKNRLSVTINNQGKSAKEPRNNYIYNSLKDTVRSNNEDQRKQYRTNIDNGKMSHEVICDDINLRPSKQIPFAKQYTITTDSGIFKEKLQNTIEIKEPKLCKSAHKSINATREAGFMGQKSRMFVNQGINLDKHTSKPFLQDIGREKNIQKTFAKINGISDYFNKSSGYTTNSNPDFQRVYDHDPRIFRKGKGMLAQYADQGTKHSFICSPFSRR
ncbi:unnamed protein product [Moneuplotes crassus]|uniref:Uncharacterized protein n=1 Tax=Euplotes crassus TaxID=5936 RepID=A0AAD1X4C0_EUPCR|nr:unnamed protein product [Moneuplotes crassus]